MAKKATAAVKKQKPYTPHGFFWRILAFCLAFILGIMSVITAVLIAGATKTRNLLNMLNLKADEYLNEEYLDKGVLEFYKELTEDLNGHAFMSLGSITKYTPYLDAYLDKVDEALATYGITLDRTTLLATDLGDFGTYFKDDVLPAIALGPVLQLDKDVTLEKINSNAPMYALAYGKYGTDYTVENGTVKMLGESKPLSAGDLLPFMEEGSSNGIMDILGKFELGSLLGLDIVLPSEEDGDNAMFYAICYGAEGVDYTFEQAQGAKLLKMADGKEAIKLEKLLTDVNGYVNTLALGDLLGLGSAENLAKRADNAILYALCYGSEGVDYNVVDNKIVPVAGGKEPTTIGNLTSGSNTFLNGLVLGDMLGLGSEESLAKRADNALLYTLCYGAEGVDYNVVDNKIVAVEGGKKPTTIGDLTEGSNTLINGLTLGDMLGLNTADKVADRANNALMYSLCYGTEGVDYTVGASGLIEMIAGHTATTVGDLTENSNGIINDLTLGEMLGLNTAEKVADRANNALMYSLCYGVEGVDYNVNAQGLIEMIADHTATTVGDLTENSNGIINGLTLGEMLGLNAADKVADRANNALMYALCYGVEGVDYNVVDNKIVHIEGGKKPTTVGTLTSESNSIIDGMEIETLLSVKPDSEAVIRYVAYGPELPKENNEYVTNPEGGYKTEEDPANQGKLRYAGGGRYIIETDEDGNKSIKMLPDPNDLSKTYAKKTVADLTAEDANLLEGMTIGSIVEIDETSSGIMQALKDWTIDDLTKQEKIEGLKIGQILDIGDDSSKIMQALKDKSLADLKDEGTIEALKIGELLDLSNSDSKIMKALEDKTLAQLKEQSTINELQLDQILDISDDSSSIMKAMKTWTLADLTNQSKIESLTLGDLIGEGATSKIMIALKDTTIEDLKKQDTIDNLVLGDILDIGDQSSGIMKAMKDWHLSDLSDQNKIESLKIGDIITINDETASGIIKAMKTWEIRDLTKQSRIDRIKIGQLLDNSDSKLMNAMKDWKLSDLTKQDMINSLTLGDVIDIQDNSPAILKSLSTMTLGELSGGIDTLTLEDVLGADQFEGGSAILNALRNVEIKEIGTAITGLTVHDVFGDEVYSYAKKTGYHEDQRVQDADKIHGNVETHYYHDNTEVFAHWYTGSESNWTKVEDDNLVKHGSYIETKVYVTREVSYLIVDYDKPQDQWQPYTGQDTIKTDDYSDYYEDADKVRHDLEAVYTYKKDGQPVENKRILTEGEGEVKYYYIDKTPVTLRYAPADGSETYTQEQITEKYMSGEDEAVRYYAGVWYLLLGKAEHGADTPLTELASLVTGVAAKMNELTLGEMYVRELISSEPNVNIEKFSYKNYKNLNELTITEIIDLLKAIVSNPLLGI